MPHEVPALAQAHAASNRHSAVASRFGVQKVSRVCSLDLRCALELVAGSQAPKSRPNGACLPLLEVKGQINTDLDQDQKDHQPGRKAH